ncbi:THAP domain-containing protein 2-like isoform X2 [Prorops nasuta]|uniref:THAP domain-containing protein 2-like isoform X2 n=1 Tax=Prorops nasuta TaxID=863751 RepID=UPI0034CE4151
MRDCMAKNCMSRRGSSRKNMKQLEWERKNKVAITFHRFPKDPLRRETWQNIMGLTDQVLPAKAALCSMHFRANHMDRTSLSCVRLKANAEPFNDIQGMSEYPREGMEIPHETANIVKEEQIKTDGASSMENRPYSPVKTEKDVQCVSDESNQQEEISTYTASQLYDEHSYAGEQEVSEPHVLGKGSPVTVKKTTEDKGVNVSPHLSENTPRKVFLRTVLKNTKLNLTKKIKTLQQKQRRLVKRLAKAKEVSRSLKQSNLINIQQLENMIDLGTESHTDEEN